MKISISSQDIFSQQVDAVVVLMGEGEQEEILKKVPKEISAALQKIITREKFSGKSDEILVCETHGSFPVNCVIFAGVGETDKITPFTLRTIFAAVGRILLKKRILTLACGFSPYVTSVCDHQQLISSAIEGINLGAYAFLKYRAKAREERALFESLTLVLSEKNKELEDLVIKSQLFVEATLFARDLVNEPAGALTAEHLAKVPQSLEKNGVKVTVRGKEEIEKLNMGAYLAVNQGSFDEPRFIELTYTPKNPKKHIVLIGKGITFDTGGLSLKPSSGMETMKMDMAGGAAVLGVFSVLGALQPDIAVTGLIAATDNMPGPKAIRPGDIVAARNGKTIEILNTDAEGRLTLADMLVYACEQKPDAIVDLATLTGAALVALGEQIAAIFANEELLRLEIEKSAHAVGEKVWPLPLENEYRKSLKSPVADLKNISSGRYGGTITAALFLEEFVDAKIPWAHLDIAGPAFEEKETPLTPHGGTGFGVRTLLQWLTSIN